MTFVNSFARRPVDILAKFEQDEKRASDDMPDEMLKY
jgi:hypothetical protein